MYSCGKAVGLPVYILCINLVKVCVFAQECLMHIVSYVEFHSFSPFYTHSVPQSFTQIKSVDMPLLFGSFSTYSTNPINTINFKKGGNKVWK
jgi:hypothetical protein